MASRALARLVVIAVLGACVGDVPESPGGAASRDTSFDRSNGGPAADRASEAAESPATRSDFEPDERLLTWGGWGPLRIGMSREEVVAAAGADANRGAMGGPDPAQCDEFRPSNAPPGVLVMVESGVLTRISVSRNSAISTPEGFRIGDPDSSVLAAYGSRARVDAHRYWPAPAKYITVWRQASSGPGRRGIRYEIDSSGEIVHLRAGGPSIEYVEGCVWVRT